MHTVYGLHPIGYEDQPPVYVGITADPRTRKMHHELRWGVRLHMSVLARHPDRRAARELERYHIRVLVGAGVKIANKNIGYGERRHGCNLYERLSLVALARENKERQTG